MSLILYLMNGKLTEVRTDTPSVNILKKDLNFAFMGIFHINLFLCIVYLSKKSDIFN